MPADILRSRRRHQPVSRSRPSCRRRSGWRAVLLCALLGGSAAALVLVAGVACWPAIQPLLRARHQAPSASVSVPEQEVTAPRHGEHLDRYEDGTLKVRANYRAGVLHGPYASFHNNGQPHVRADYRNGQLDGDYQESTPSGQLAWTAGYRAGQLHGWSVRFDHGQPVSSQFYKDGQCLIPKGLDEIKRELAEIHRVAAEQTEAGPLTRERHEALRRLKAYRYLCDVPYRNLQLSPELNRHAQAAAQICERIDRLDHKPENPGLPKEEYDLAFKGASSSNLCQGRDTLPESLDDYMDDSDASNIDRLGHRRWCLNPAMKKTGFGKSGSYSAMWAVDQSQSNVPEYELVSYPPRGYLPLSYFRPGCAWSVSLCPHRYRSSLASVQVKVYRLDESWGKIGPALELAYFKVDCQEFGIDNCIIFQPKDLALAEQVPGDESNKGRFGFLRLKPRTQPSQRFWVELEGVKDLFGKPATVQYLTEFVTLN